MPYAACGTELLNSLTMPSLACTMLVQSPPKVLVH
jgi:hypothetical protein